MVLEAIQQIVSATGGLPSSGDEEMTYEVSNILFKKAVVLAVDATHNQLDLSMTPMSKSSSSWFSFRFQSLQATQWETHCTGEVRAMNRRCNSGEPNEVHIVAISKQPDYSIHYGPVRTALTIPSPQHALVQSYERVRLKLRTFVS